MTFAVGVLTYKPLVNLRWSLFEETLRSLRVAFGGDGVDTFERLGPRWVLDSGCEYSVDPDPDGPIFDEEHYAICDLARSNGYLTCGGSVENRSPGCGRNFLLLGILEAMKGVNEDTICVLSDDDMTWPPDAAPRLCAIWSHAPEDLIVVSGLLEPEYPWSTIRGVLDLGGEKVLVRDSAPAAAWTFRMRDRHLFFPLKETTEGTGEDFDACERLRSRGLRVAQADLADHAGSGYSLLGNDSARSLVGRPVDRLKWGLPERG